MNTKIVVKRSENDNGANGEFFKSSKSIICFGIELNKVAVQSTADAPNGTTLPAGEYEGELLNKSGSYNNAIHLVNEKLGALSDYTKPDGQYLDHPNCKTAKNQTSEYLGGVIPYSEGCQIQHFNDFSECTQILQDLGFKYGTGDTAWERGDTVKYEIKAPIDNVVVNNSATNLQGL